jgi:hypothetical protein
MVETSTALHNKSASKPSLDAETTDMVRAALQRSPGKPIHHVNSELQIPKSSVHRILHKSFKLQADKIQAAQAPKLDDKPRR